MWDRDITFGLDSLAACLAWIGGASCLAAAWTMDWAFLGWLGVFLAVIAAVLTVMHDNAKTRRVVRMILRDQVVPERDFTRIH